MNHKIFAIEIKNHYIKTAFIQKSKKGLITVNFNAVKIKSGQDRLEMLMYLVNKYKLKQAQKLAVSLADNNFIIRDIKLPATNNEEIAPMLDFQISKLSPFTKEEIAFDYIKIYQDDSGYSQLFVPIIQKENVYEFDSLINSTNLKVGGFRLSFEAALSAINYFKSKNSAFMGLGDYIFINLDNFDTSISFIKNNAIAFLRSIPYGVNDIKNSMSNFKSELTATIKAIKDKFSDIDANSVFIGGARISNDLKKRMADECGIKLNFINFFEDSLDIKFNFDNSGEDISYLSCFGMLACSQNMFFSSREVYKKDSDKNFMKLFYSKTAILSYIFALLAMIVFSVKFIERKDMLRDLERKIKSLNIDTAGIKESFLVAQIKKEDLADILLEFYNIIPQNIVLDNLSYNYNQDFVIKGTAGSIREINNFINLLKETQYFKNAQLKYAVKNKAENAQKVSFQIDFYLKKK